MKLKNILVSLFVAVFMLAAPVYAGDAVNLNTANVEQLTAVKGIGEKTAAAIVAYRDEHGAFAKVDDLLNVKGIGEKKLATIRDAVAVGGTDAEEKAAH
ncbi:competence protein ComEA [Mariprofundus ferrinatatus]|uniref:Competence protein ComEA n=1 Tax=Mariprofundus ferrinatatus TaxID=1921087 RepID=A0A2K8L2B7_9PROT|nr:helix-hairpin-helix domain-containing protein [Mariprofundus ferrinatatus]ATX81437.1 competence protein ComEA [Mariprofundus ferrinatatus]